MSNTERFIRRTKEKFGRAHDGIFIGGVAARRGTSVVRKLDCRGRRGHQCGRSAGWI